MLSITLVGISLCWLLWQNMVEGWMVQEVVAVRQREDDMRLLFPCGIDGTDLIIEDLTFYEGPYLEDGTYEEVYDVAALIVRNNGEEILSRVSIVVQTEKTMMLFEGSWFLPGQTCVLLEKKRCAYTNEAVIDCEGRFEVYTGGNLLDKQIEFYEDSNDRITITNLSENDLQQLRIAYKTYLAQTDMYIGGITYEIGIAKLTPGQSETFAPPHYAKDYSKVFLAYTEENDE